MFRGLIALALAWCAGPGWAGCTDGVVALRGDWGETRFNIEIADTVKSRAQGLMFVETLPTRAGMLFVYDSPQRASFWMKNTLIPLDMLFVDSTGTVTHIHNQAIPGDLTPIAGGDAVYAVLEINGGLAKTYGISVGSLMQHKVFSNGPAAWPC